MFVIDTKKCVDCGYCAYVCPFSSLTHHVEQKVWEIDQAKCHQCGICFAACVALAIDCDLNQQVVATVEIGDKCIGCSMCARDCPVGAVEGKFKEQHKIDPDKCILCGTCADNCRAGAITVTRRNVYDAKGKRTV